MRRKPMRHPRQIVWLLGLGVALSLPGDATMYVVLPTHTAAAGIALADVGLMLSANRLIRLLLNTPIGLLIERLPRRRILIPAMLLGALSTLLYTVPGFWPLLIGRLLWGVSWAGIWLGASTAVLDLATDTNRGRFSGQLQGWFFFGVGLTAILAGVLSDVLGYQTGLVVSASVTGLMALIWLMWLPETRPAGPSALEHAVTAQATSATAARPVRTRWPLAVAIAVLGINWLVFLGVLAATLPLLLQERLGDTLLLAGLIIPLSTVTGALTAGNQLAGLIAAPAAGWLSDRSGRRWSLITLACLAAIAALVLIAFGDAVLAALATTLSAAATSIMQTQVMTLIGDYAGPNRQGRLLGVTNTVGDLGSAAGPLLAYALLPQIGLEGIFVLMAAVMVLVMPLSLRYSLAENRPRSHPASITEPGYR
jgi:MFS family permease